MQALFVGAGGLKFKGLIEKNANLNEITENGTYIVQADHSCLLYTSPSPRD